MQTNRQSFDREYKFLFLIYRFQDLVRNPRGPIGSDAQARRGSVAATLRLKVRTCREQVDSPREGGERLSWSLTSELT